MQDKQYVMALDAGTTSNRAIIFDNESHISVSAKKNLPSISQSRAGLNTMPMKFITPCLKLCGKLWPSRI